MLFDCGPTETSLGVTIKKTGQKIASLKEDEKREDEVEGGMEVRRRGRRMKKEKN